MTDTDVVVVGGGPVGLACAIEARLIGLDVVVLEPRPGPVDKACGEGLMPGTLQALHRLGVDPAGHPLRGIRYAQSGRSVVHDFRDGPGRGVRRTVLHAALAARAADLGVQVVQRRAEDVAVHGASVQAGGVSGRWLLACDGLHSPTRRQLGLEADGPRRAAGRRYGLRMHVRLPPWDERVEVHWGPAAEAYVTPVAPDLVGIAVLGPRGIGMPEALAALPELAGRLDGAEQVGPVRGAGPLDQRTTARHLGRARLVGDASGYVDALTGEGLRVGLAQARAVVEHLDDGAAYGRAWSSTTRDYRVLTKGLVAWARSPLRPLVVPVAAAAPGLYGAIVERLAR